MPRLWGRGIDAMILFLTGSNMILLEDWMVPANSHRLWLRMVKRLRYRLRLCRLLVWLWKRKLGRIGVQIIPELWHRTSNQR